MKTVALLVGLGFVLSLTVVGVAEVSPDLKKEEPSLQLQRPSLASALLDPSRLSMWHSYSLSFISGGGHSQTIGLYMNSIEYQVSRPLTLRLHLGYLHRPSALFSGRGNSSLGGSFLPGFELDYRPSDNFFLKLNMSSYTYPYYYGVYPRDLGKR